MPREKICVIGCGPIGTLTCLYICLNQECDITFIDTHHDKEWINTYCVWESEVLDTWLWTFLDNIKVSVVKKKWDYSAYIFQKEAIKLKQPYYMLDNQQLKSTIYGELSKRGVRFINGHVSNIEESDGYVDVCFSNVRYEHIEFDYVYNCSGHFTTIQDYEANMTRRWQSCYGYFVKCHRPHGYDTDIAVIMDWRECSVNQHTQPSFCYILPIDDTKILIEETYLVNERPVNTSLMHETLYDRLDSLGIEKYDILHKEIGSFPIGGGLPINSSRTKALGAAGRWVNPATGYHVGYAIRQIPHALQGGATISKIRNLLYCQGGYVLMRLNYESIVDFFNSFFKLEQALVEAYLWRTCRITDIVRMGSLLCLKLSWTTRLKVFYALSLYAFDK